MLNPEELKCHEDLITLDTYAQQGTTMDNKFDIYVKTYFISVAIWGPGGGGGFNNTLYLIIIYMTNIEAI